MDQSSQPMDLLSAALSESGVTEELEDFDPSGFDFGNIGTPSNPVQQQPLQQITTQAQVYPGASTPNNNVQFVTTSANFNPGAPAVRMAGASTPIRIVQQGGIVRALRPGAPQVVRTPTSQNVRRVIIRTPQSTSQPMSQAYTQPVIQQASGLRLASPNVTVRPQGQNIVMAQSGRNSPSMQHQQAMVNNKNVRIIKIAKPDQAPANSPQPKILKIVKTNTPSGGGGGNAVKRIVVQARSTGSGSTPVVISSNQINTMASSGTGNPVQFVRQQVPSNLVPGMQVISSASRGIAVPGLQTNTVKNYAPTPKKAVASNGAKFKNSPVETETIPNRFKESVRTYSKHTPKRPQSETNSSKTVTLSDVGPNLSSVSTTPLPQNTITVQSVPLGTTQPMRTVVPSQSVQSGVQAIAVPSAQQVNSSVAMSQASSQQIKSSVTTNISSQPAVTKLSVSQSAELFDAAFAKQIAESKDPPAPNITQTESPKEPIAPAAPSFDQVMQMEHPRLKKLASRAIQERSSSPTSTPTNHPFTTKLKNESVKDDFDAIFNDDVKQENKPSFDKMNSKDASFIFDAPISSDLMNVKRELEENLFKDLGLIEDEVKADTSEKSNVTKMDTIIKQESQLDIKEEPMETKPELSSNTLIKTETPIKTEPISGKDMKYQGQTATSGVVKVENVKSEPVVKSETPTPVSTTVPAVKQEILSKTEEKSNTPKADSESTENSGALGGGGLGDLGGGDFFQALAQLQDTNQKAEVFENQVKSTESSVATAPESMATSSVPKPTALASSPSIQNPNLTQSVSASNLVRNAFMQSTGQTTIPVVQQGNNVIRLGGPTNITQQQQRIMTSSGSTANFMTSQSNFMPQVRGTTLVSPLDEVLTTGTSQPPLRINRPGSVSSGTVYQPQRMNSPYSMQRTQVVGGRSGSPVTVVQRVNSPNTTSGSSLIRVISNPQSLTPNQRVVQMSRGNTMTLPVTQQQRIQVVTRPDMSTPTRVMHTIPRVIQTPGSGGLNTMRRVIGPDGTQRLVSLQQEHRPSPPPPPIKLTDKDVSRIWANEEIKLRSIQSEPNFQRSGSPGLSMLGGMMRAQEEEVEEEEQELGVAETYSDYMPSKSKIGCRHPDTVVETSSLSSVESPDIHYKLHIPEHIIDQGLLSALQLETIIYASQKHNTFLPSGERAGFLVGDGAGVGKGRTIAGFIYENYLQGRKRSLWLSVSNDLRVDAERDLRDIGASKIDVHPLNKFKYAKISSSINGKVKKGVVFSTYSALIGESSASGKYRTRFKQLIHWLGKDFDGLLVFDECHRAKNLCPVGSSKPTKTGLTVLELQNRLPKARVVYASATGASEPRNMAYMTRLGLWGKGTPFNEFMDFIQAVEKRGVGAMELVAMDMKLRGTYIARQLSFHGVQFKVETVPVNEKLYEIYNKSVKVWVDARAAFAEAGELMGSEARSNKTMWGQFWSAHQRFFKYLCISAKVDHCVKLARDAIKSGKCVVIGLQSTGEARTQEALEEFGEITDFVSTAKGVFQSMVERHFPAPNKKKTFDLLSLFDDEEKSTESSKRGNKRKKTFAEMCDVKRRREDWSSDGDSDDNSDSDKNDAKNKPNKKPHKKSNPKKRPAPSKKREKSSAKSSSSEDDGNSSSGDNDDDDEKSESDKSESESNESEAEDFNPFGAGSDSDDDPWLKRSKAKKQKKEKKKKKEKSPGVNGKHKKKKKKNKKDDDSDIEEDFDKQFDKVLMASGLKSTTPNPDNPGSMPALATGADDADKACELRSELLLKIERLGELLPPNTLDQLIDDLGGTDSVAEMTGRKGRVVSDENGQVYYESRSESDVPLEILNLAEKQRFMDGEKFIAVISEAASSGISLQADRRVNNQRRRVHITLELPWSADRAIQQFGRTHRSNQISAPQYIFLISDLAGERRFASTVSKRLESLGALTHGDRRATETRDLSQFNIDNQYGKTALEAVMKSIAGMESALVAPPADYPGNFFLDAREGLVGVGLITYVDRLANYAALDKDYNNMSKFLNRLLGTEVRLQNALFKYFTETLSAICLQAKRNGRWDLGILDLGSGGERVKLLSTKSFVGSFSGITTKVEIHSISCERGMSYAEALRKWHDHSAPDDGFYVSADEKNGRRGVVLAVQLQGKRNKAQQLFNVYKPNSGLQGRPEQLKNIKSKYRKALPDGARKHWEDQHSASATMCSHAYWKGSCRKSQFQTCEVGLRSRTYYVLSGSVLSVWTTVERVLMSTPGHFASRMQVIRLRTDEGKRIVGTLIPFAALSNLEAILSQETRIYNTHHGTSSLEAQDAAKGLSNGSLASAPLATKPLATNHNSAFRNNQFQNSVFRQPGNGGSQGGFVNTVSNPRLLGPQRVMHSNQNTVHGNRNLSGMSSLVHSNSMSVLDRTVNHSIGNQGLVALGNRNQATIAPSNGSQSVNKPVIKPQTEQQYISMPEFF